MSLPHSPQPQTPPCVQGPSQEPLLLGDAPPATTTNSTTNPTTTTTTNTTTVAAPLVAAAQHLLQPNGSLRGQAVADHVVPQFPTLLSAIPRTSTRPALYSSSPPPVAVPHSTSHDTTTTTTTTTTTSPPTTTDGPLTHADVYDFLARVGPQFHAAGIGRGHRVAVVLPNGPILAVALLAVSTWATCLPLNALGAPDEVRHELQAAQCDVILGQPKDHDNNDTNSLAATVAQQLNVPLIRVISHPHDPAGKFSLVFENDKQTNGFPLVGLPKHHQQSQQSPHVSSSSSSLTAHETTDLLSSSRFTANSWNDVVLLLFTSGTTGGKKLVPHSWQSLLVATACIAVSWQLTPDDINCNFMPLFHVGGIVRQVYAPLCSGGAVICCPTVFDPLLFWQLLVVRPVSSESETTTTTNPPNQNKKKNPHIPPPFTWYYAAPTMHQLILETGRAEGYLPPSSLTAQDGSAIPPQPQPFEQQPFEHSLRMIANAAGGLSPRLARELQHAFGGNNHHGNKNKVVHVLPSYGMTECMPISAPPATYQLEKPGTSGVAVGPEIAILNAVTHCAEPPGTEGPICVRGPPLFGGYAPVWTSNSSNDTSSSNPLSRRGDDCLLPGGWFDTGDLGYLDADGYLYITGRSKEVINRGGEIISPLEVEEACMAHPDIDTAVAFAAQHDVLQEVVALVVVPATTTTNNNTKTQPLSTSTTTTRRIPKKIDLPGLHAFLGQGRLAAPKWPQCLVYMDAVPKSHTNKLLRVKLGERLKLPQFHDSMYPIERTFQATCPPLGTPLSVPIPCQPVTVHPQTVQDILQHEFVNQLPPLPASSSSPSTRELAVTLHPLKLGHLVVHVYNIHRMEVIEAAQELLDAYTMPSHVCTLTAPVAHSDLTRIIPEPSDAVASILQQAMGQGPTADPLVSNLQQVFQDLLDLDCQPAPDTNFFHLGGSSMMASQLASKIRKIHNVAFGGAEVFHHPNCSAIADVIRERRGEIGMKRSLSSVTNNASIRDKASLAASSLFSQKLNLDGVKFDSTRIHVEPDWKVHLLQLLPLFVIHPLWQLTRFFMFFQTLLVVLKRVPNEDNLVAFVITLVTFHFIWIVITPLVFVAIKWIVIGKYKAGRYPIWGEYYMRWWFVDILRKMIGLGFYGSSEALLREYYRWCGATIGTGARISVSADIAEFDLVHIGEEAAIDFSVVRGFAVDSGCALLGPVTVGNHASVSIRAIVAPHTSIPDHTHLSPGGTSYEIHAGEPGQDIQHLRYNRYAMPGPNFWYATFITAPIVTLVEYLSHIPALAIFWYMVQQPWRSNHEPFDSIPDLMQWLCDPRRIPYYICIRIARAIGAPVVHMLLAVLIKRLIIGKFRPGPRDTTSNWQLVRHQLASKLFTREKMNDFTELIGRHYELVSVLYRCLGAKVGKRVFWPGQQPVFSGEFDLLEIGDDVVFGSRSAIYCSTIDSCDRVVLCAGSNMADNTVVLPGSILGKNAVLGSNAICPQNRYLSEGSIWFGARCGEPVLLGKGVDDQMSMDSSNVSKDHIPLQGDDSTIRPFGRAFYQSAASYFVVPIPLILLYTFFTKVLIAAIQTMPILGALYLSAGILFGFDTVVDDYDSYRLSLWGLYSTMGWAMLLANASFLLCWLTIEVSAKWIFMGRRQEGTFSWDTSTYSQNWEFYQLACRIRSMGRSTVLDFLSGTSWLAWFFRLLGAKIGSNCCLYPSRADLIMTEPDLVAMGDRVVLDCAHVVAHLNTRGNFELKRIELESNVTLRNSSRVQQGVRMETGSMLLEKALVLTGEVVEADSIWIGAPASRLSSSSSSETSSLGSRPSLQDMGAAETGPSPSRNASSSLRIPPYNANSTNATGRNRGGNDPVVQIVGLANHKGLGENGLEGFVLV